MTGREAQEDNKCNFADGDIRVVMIEGQPMHRGTQELAVADMTTRRSRLDETGSIPVTVTSLPDAVGRR